MNQPPSPPVAVITGAASGIGLATALHFAEIGYRVFTCDLHAPPPPRPENWIAHLIGDVRELADLRRLINTAADGGPIDCLVNNAGVNLVGDVADITEADWDRCLDTNLKAAFFACQFVLPFMELHGGAIINVASNAGLLPRAHDPVYSTSKQALVGLTRSLALSLSPRKIRVNAVCPGPVARTGMIEHDLERAENREATLAGFINASPLARAHGRLITPEEVAAAIAYLASPAAAMITGTSVAIDGGKSLGVPPRQG